MRTIRYALAVAVLLSAPAVLADAGVAVRAGTLGLGLDLDFQIVGPLNARIGYSGFNINRTVDQTDVTYDGKLKLSSVTALLDWRPFYGSFRLSAGLLGSGTKIDITGTPSAAGTFTLNGHTYTSQDVGTLNGEIKPNSGAVPYVGLGFGNVAGTSGHVHVLFDLGAAYGGSPSVALAGTCGPAAPSGSALCTQLQADVAQEQAKLAKDVTILKWYPVVSLGVGVSF
jgi:hypothetical protein